jgi:type II secretory pathway pseudopilin PulG
VRWTQKRTGQEGFTLVELMTALGIFLLICGAAFTLLGVSQKRYQTDSQVLNSFEEARFGLDQIVRDVSDSGYPPQNHFAVLPTPDKYVISPFAWNPNYSPNTPCSIGTAGGGTCVTPGDFDLIVETNIDPQRSDSVSWIHYLLQGTTLMRGVAGKPNAPNADPVAGTAQALVPFVENVVNAAPPGGNPVPIFSYICDTSGGPQPCISAGSGNSPANIRDVAITLIVVSPVPDTQTGQLRPVELSGRGRRINPNQ